MALAAPTLTQFPTPNADQEIVVALSKLKGDLEVGIPDSAYSSPLNEALAILNLGKGDQEWRGNKTPTGQYSEETDDVERTPNLRVYVAREELEKYVNKPVTLCYEIGGENEPQTSLPLTLRIEQRSALPTKHRFNFPTSTRLKPLDMPMEFDVHMSIGDWVEFEWMPGKPWEITRKILKVSGDNTVEHIDYMTVPVEHPGLP